MSTIQQTIQSMINGGNSTNDIRAVLDSIDATQQRIAELTAQRDAIELELSALTDTTAIETATETVASITGAIELEQRELARLVSISSGRARGMTIGIEIEFLAPSSMDAFRDCLQSQLDDSNSTATVSRNTGGLHNNTISMWQIARDSSISVNNYEQYGMEIISPVLKGESGLMQAVEVMQALEHCGAEVNRSCGVHVHFGVERMAWKSVRRIIETYTYNQDLIATTLPESRRNSRWCRNIPLNESNSRSSVSLERFQSFGDECNTASVVTAMGGRSDYSDNRYFNVNLLGAYSRHKTIEFRAHGGTVDGEKLEMWVRFLHLIVKSAETNRATNVRYETLSQMCASLSDKTDLNLTHAQQQPASEWAQMVNAIRTGTDSNTGQSPYRSRAKAQLAGKAIADYLDRRAITLATA